MQGVIAAAACIVIASINVANAATLIDTFNTNSGAWSGNQPTGSYLGVFPQNPTTPPSITAADGISDGNFMRLKDGTRRAFTTLGFDAVGTEYFSRVTGSFDLRLTCLGERTGFSGGGCADGFAFSFLNTETFGSTGPVATSRGDAVIGEGGDISDFTDNPATLFDDSFTVGLAVFAPAPALNTGSFWASDGDRFNATGYIVNNPSFDMVTGIRSTPGRFLTLGFDVDFVTDSFSLSVFDGLTEISIFDDADISQFGLDAYNSRLAFGTRSGDAGLFVDIDNVDIKFTHVPSPVPLPAAGWLLLAGVAGLTALRRKTA